MSSVTLEFAETIVLLFRRTHSGGSTKGSFDIHATSILLVFQTLEIDNLFTLYNCFSLQIFFLNIEITYFRDTFLRISFQKIFDV
jgi:hypothetical protein